jgi:hypothetical protein
MSWASEREVIILISTYSPKFIYELKFFITSILKVIKETEN